MTELEIISSLQKNLPDFFKVGKCSNLKKFRLSKRYYDRESDVFTTLINDISAHTYDYILQDRQINKFIDKYFVNCIDSKKDLLYESGYIDACYHLFQKNIITNSRFGMFFSENPKFFFDKLNLTTSSPLISNSPNFLSKIGKYLDKDIFVNYYLNTTESTMLSFDEIIYDFSINMLKITDSIDNTNNKQIDIEYSVSYEFINKRIICVLTDKFSKEYREYVAVNRNKKINNILDERDS